MNFYDILGIPKPKEDSKSTGKRRAVRLVKYRAQNAKPKRSVKQNASEPAEPTEQIDELPASTTAEPEQAEQVVQHTRDSNDRNKTFECLTLNTTVEKLDPKITRPTISIFEYAHVHTMLADYIESHKSVKDFTDDIEVKGLINPLEIAFHLLLENKWDATIDRGYEVVSYSRLKKNPQWEKMIKHRFDEQHQVHHDELFQPLGLL